MSALSNGWLRKAALGRVLVSLLHVLLLDEPTSHLDIEAMTGWKVFENLPGKDDACLLAKEKVYK